MELERLLAERTLDLRTLDTASFRAKRRALQEEQRALVEGSPERQVLLVEV